MEEFRLRYKVNEYVSFLRQRGLATNNLYGVSIQTPIRMKYKIKENEVKYIEGDDNSNSSINGQGMLEGILNTTKYTTKGVGLAKSAISIFTGQPTTGNFGNIKTQGFKKIQKGLSSFFGGMKTDSGEMLEMLCTSTQLPFSNLKMGDTFYNHYKHKFITGVDTDPIQMSFYVDRQSMYVLDFFDKWIKYISSSEGQVGWMEYKKNYAVEINIALLNKDTGDFGTDSGLLGDGNGRMWTMFNAKLVDAYPVKIEPITLSSGATELIQVKVTFDYDKLVMTRTPDKRKLSGELNLTGAKLKDMGIIDRKNMATQAISQAKDIASNVIYDAKTVIANIHETKNSVTSVIKSIKNLPKTAKAEANDIKESAKKAVKF
jgi:hypothetical protein